MRRARGASRDHVPDSKVRRATATARSTSSASQAATSNSVSPVSGLTHANVAPAAASVNCPSMNAWRRNRLVSGSVEVGGAVVAMPP